MSIGYFARLSSLVLCRGLSVDTDLFVNAVSYLGSVWGFFFLLHRDERSKTESIIRVTDGSGAMPEDMIGGEAGLELLRYLPESNDQIKVASTPASGTCTGATVGRRCGNSRRPSRLQVPLGSCEVVAITAAPFSEVKQLSKYEWRVTGQKGSI